MCHTLWGFGVLTVPTDWSTLVVLDRLCCAVVGEGTGSGIVQRKAVTLCRPLTVGGSCDQYTIYVYVLNQYTYYNGHLHNT